MRNKSSLVPLIPLEIPAEELAVPTTGLQPVLKPSLSQHLHAVISFSELCKFYISAVTS